MNVSEWCDLWEMKLNASKTNTMMHRQSPALTIGGTVLKKSVDLVILGVTLDSKMTFEKHLRSVSRAASQWLSILRKFWQVFHDRLLLGRCSRGGLYTLKLRDHVVSGASFLTGGVSDCDLAHRRSVAVLCMLYKIRSNPMYPLYGALTVPYVPVLYLCRMGLSFYGLILRGCGLRTDRVLIAISQPCIANLL